MRATVNVDCDTYSIQPLQKRAIRKLRAGMNIHPKRAKDILENDGKSKMSPKLQSVRITP
jgi:hypothetical protein